MPNIWHYARERQLFEDVVESEETTGPYLRRVITRRIEQSGYNPNYGDARECKCKHLYYRHFDAYENNQPVGCKYCDCHIFKEDI